MNITCNSNELLDSLLKAKEEIEEKLRSSVCSFSARMVGITAYNTPIGDADQYEDLYLRRYLRTGLSPIEGLARGGWQATNSPFARFREQYGVESAQLAISDAYDDMYQRYTLGDDVYISNKGPYIVELENNSSDQTNGMGILQPSIDQIVAVFATDFKGIYARA